MIYKTQCHASNAYTQTCQQVRPSSHVTSLRRLITDYPEQVPAQTCYPETVCHKTPHTKCHQTRTQKCTKVRTIIYPPTQSCSKLFPGCP